MTKTDHRMQGALFLLLKHHETGCDLAAQQAAYLLAHIADQDGLDNDFRGLCDRACLRLGYLETAHNICLT